MITRIYTGNDGQTHFEDVHIPAADMQQVAIAAGTSISFRRFPNRLF